jgi:hypothetical protein
MSFRRWFAGGALSFSLFACSQPAEEPAEQAAQHAPADVEPGTYEDWCGEHEVPESMCTRCNSSLIPAFQATGDWCAEHGLPESQCRACNPDLRIERPARRGS